ncbi:MAG: hypothetical protein GY847_16370 [Proteobacteria bacterium]|nr:hypothetical protein [Pseudomonadota bacterium]
MDNGEFSLEDRVLCSDEACIGVIGTNGNCGVCGKVYTGSEPLSEAKEEESSLPNVPDDYNAEAETKADEEPETDAPTDPSERVCCPDDMCIGIIGESGKCGICGKIL